MCTVPLQLYIVLFLHIRGGRDPSLGKLLLRLRLRLRLRRLSLLSVKSGEYLFLDIFPALGSYRMGYVSVF